MLTTAFRVLTEEEENSPDADDIARRTYVLSEVTIECTASELDRLVRFLEYAREEYMGFDGYGHLHLRDWDRDWTTDESDLMVLFNVDALRG